MGINTPVVKAIEPREKYRCRVCGDGFHATVPSDLIHCRRCHHHYPKDCGECGNCHRRFGNNNGDLITVDSSRVA